MSRSIHALLVGLSLLLGTAEAQIVPRIGPNLQINDTPAFPASAVAVPRGVIPDIAELEIPGAANQSYAVVWREQINGQSRLFAATVGELGNIIGEKFLLREQVGTEFIGNPAVAADGEGNFAVVWAVMVRTVSPGGQYFYAYTKTIEYRLFRPLPTSGGNLQPLGGGTRTLIDTASLFAPDTGDFELNSRRPNVDLAASNFGRFALVFSDDRNFGDQPVSFARPESSDDFSIHVALFDLNIDGTAAELAPFPVGATPILISNNGEHQARPRIAMNSNNETSVVVYRNADGLLKAQRLTANGALAGPSFNLTAASNAVGISFHNPDVAVTLAGDILTSWEYNHYRTTEDPTKFSQVMMARFSAGGVAIGAPIEVATGPAPGNPNLMLRRRNATLRARDTDDNAMVVWQQAEQGCSGPNPVIFNVATCNGGILSSAAQTCVVDLALASVGECLAAARLAPVDAAPSSGWYAIRNDWPSSFENDGVAARLWIDVQGNFSGTQNRCFQVEVGSNTGTPGQDVRQIEQRCSASNPNNCMSCAQQAAAAGQTWSPAKSEAMPSGADSQAQPAAAVLGANDNYDVFARWFHSSFGSEGATFIDQFRVNDAAAGDQHGPAIGQQRDGDMIVAWAEGDGVSAARSLSVQRLTSAVELSVNDVGILEGPLRATAGFSVTASKAYPDPDPGDPNNSWPAPSLSFLTADGSASFLTDYARETGTLSFQPGQPLAQPVNVSVVEDTIYENTEDFALDIFDATDAIIVKSRGIGVIVDNDPPETVSIADVALCENGDPVPALPALCSGATTPGAPNPTVTLTVSLDKAQEVDGSVQFRTLDGVATPTSAAALAGVDYEPVTGELQFLAGAETGFVTIEILDNGVQELDKVFRVELFEPSDLTLSIIPIAEVTLVNDDACATLPVVSFPGGGSIVALATEGDTAYLCVDNPDPDNCSWSSRLEFVPGLADDWITREDVLLTPPEVPPAAANCNAGAEGYIKLVADPNLPPPPPVTEGGGSVSRTVKVKIYGASSAEVPGVSPAVFDVTQAGGACDPVVSQSQFRFYPVGGNGEFNVTLPSPPENPTLCNNVAWQLSLSAGAQPWVSGLRINGALTTAGIGNGVVSFTVAPNTVSGAAERTGAILVNAVPVTVAQEAVFFDPFDDQSLASDWSYSSPGAWSETSGRLTVDAQGLETAIATPAFPGCRVCEVQSAMRTDRFGKGQGLLYAWYVDPQNHVVLVKDEFLDRWQLIQRSNGVDQLIKTYASNILTGTLYPVSLRYDGNPGNVLTLTINGVAVCPPTSSGMPVCVASEPVSTGTVGFAAEASGESFDLIKVIRSDGPEYSIVPPDPSVFANGFE